MARYICLEGTEGVGKTTQTTRLVEHLQSKGFKVLQTKEPGTPLSPLTMEMRKLMLDAQFDEEMTPTARELISQAIRSVHLEKVVLPALEEYDFIVQDRGILSGLAYGTACGNEPDWLLQLARTVTPSGQPYDLYNQVIYLTSERTAEKLEIAKSAKQEFEAGDAMEARGADFMAQVQVNMDNFSKSFNTVKINVDDKNIEQVFDAIISSLNV